MWSFPIQQQEIDLDLIPQDQLNAFVISYFDVHDSDFHRLYRLLTQKGYIVNKINIFENEIDQIYMSVPRQHMSRRQNMRERMLQEQIDNLYNQLASINDQIAPLKTRKPRLYDSVMEFLRFRAVSSVIATNLPPAPTLANQGGVMQKRLSLWRDSGVKKKHSYRV
tara:strand:+ start:2554 stop:3051 length:498 start_codon:yes stop_codon:yes gene_type:complete